MSIWPALIYLCLTFVSVGIAMAKHGEPSKPHDFVTTLISAAIILPILYWGGFFDVLFAKL